MKGGQIEKTFVNVLDAHAPEKTKVLRGDHTLN